MEIPDRLKYKQHCSFVEIKESALKYDNKERQLVDSKRSLRNNKTEGAVGVKV